MLVPAYDQGYGLFVSDSDTPDQSFEIPVVPRNYSSSTNEQSRAYRFCILLFGHFFGFLSRGSYGQGSAN
jgi:hypothetical protein